MSRHSFDPEIAATVGINAAVIYQNILWWCERNAIKDRNIHDGRAWTYNSIKQFEAFFPYLSAKQIRTALDTLEGAEYLVTGCYNTDARDRTKWYSPFALEVKLHLPHRADTFAPQGEPLPVSKPDINITPNPKGGSDLFSANDETEEPDETDVLEQSIEKGFAEFWNEIWPSHSRKASKAKCNEVYRKTCLGKIRGVDQVSPADLNGATRAYIAQERQNHDLKYLKGPLPWLRLPGWEPFIGQGNSQPFDPERQRYRDLAAQYGG